MAIGLKGDKRETVKSYSLPIDFGSPDKTACFAVPAAYRPRPSKIPIRRPTAS